MGCFRLLIKSFKINKKLIIFFIILFLLLTSISIFYSFANEEEKDSKTKKDFIKWVDFNVTAEALKLTAKLDIDSHNNKEDIQYNWIELLSYLACKNGGDFKNFKKTDLDILVNQIKEGESIADLTRKLKIL